MTLNVDPPQKPRVTVPMLTAPFDDKYRDGYDFIKGRWEGEEYKPNAVAAAKHLVSRGHKAAVYTGEVKNTWHRGKMQNFTYYRVFIINPKDPDLFMWWYPEEKEWQSPVDFKLATWFELR